MLDKIKNFLNKLVFKKTEEQVVAAPYKIETPTESWPFPKTTVKESLIEPVTSGVANAKKPRKRKAKSDTPVADKAKPAVKKTKKKAE